MNEFIDTAELDDAGLTGCPVDAARLLRVAMSERDDQIIRDVVNDGRLGAGFATEDGPSAISCAWLPDSRRPGVAMVLAPLARGQTARQWLAAMQGDEEVNELTERGVVDGGVSRFHVPLERVSVTAGAKPEGVADQVDDATSARSSGATRRRPPRAGLQPVEQLRDRDETIVPRVGSRLRAPPTSAVRRLRARVDSLRLCRPACLRR